MSTDVELTYYDIPQSEEKKTQPFIRNYRINIDERKGQRFLDKKTLMILCYK